MFRAGHYGVSLLVWSPIGLALLTAGYPQLAVGGGAVMFALSRTPDVDHDLPLVSHRGATHTLVFAVLVGSVVGIAGWLFGQSTALLAFVGLSESLLPGIDSTIGLAAFGFAVGTLAVLAHLLGDTLTPAGVALFWPLSGRTYTIGLASASNPIANYGLLALGVAATVTALLVSLRGLG